MDYKQLAECYKYNKEGLKAQINYDERMLKIDAQRLSEARKCLNTSKKALRFLEEII